MNHSAFNVTFLFENLKVLFKPTVGEILTARIMDCTSRGLRLSMGFFDNIFILLEQQESNNDLYDLINSALLRTFTMLIEF